LKIIRDSFSEILWVTLLKIIQRSFSKIHPVMFLKITMGVFSFLKTEPEASKFYLSSQDCLASGPTFIFENKPQGIFIFKNSPHPF